MEITDSLLRRFWAKVDMRLVRYLGEDPCWTWRAATDQRGYGSFRIAGKTHKAHRISWLIEHGTLPDDLFVCHRCDNPSCVNPGHLFLGTNRDNMHDMHAKGRRSYTLLERCARGHEFTPENTYLWRGHRHCRKCAAIRAWLQRNPGAAAKDYRDRYSATRCKHGHRFTPENTYWHTRSNGKRERACRRCRSERTIRSRQRAVA